MYIYIYVCIYIYIYIRAGKAPSQRYRFLLRISTAPLEPSSSPSGVIESDVACSDLIKISLSFLIIAISSGDDVE